ncbi:MAG: ABC transporter ATP-binding protein [Actinobacteria bacterium]|nr:ABC transporter ATP-binding protein [Actinomycetota bacterium]MCG2799812.1 ABC transporter ATP-binding protein [Cellulomonas sp.]
MSGPALIARQVTVRYGRHTAVRQVDLEVRPGRLHALLGPNGAGKSTLVRALAHITPPTAGDVVVDGAHLPALPARARARRIAFLPQDTVIEPAFTVLGLVRLGRYAHIGRWRSAGCTDEHVVRESLERVGVADLADRTVPSLSGGQRQLVLLAKALAQQSRYLLLDEPVSALDLHHQLRVLTLLRELADEGTGVAVVLHDLDLAARFADHVSVLSQGTVAAAGAPTRVLTADLLLRVYRVTAQVSAEPATGAVHVCALHAVETSQPSLLSRPDSLEDPCTAPV